MASNEDRMCCEEDVVRLLLGSLVAMFRMEEIEFTRI